MRFFEKVYKEVKQIPKGRVASYKQIGDKLKSRAYRAIGQALKNNPTPILIPCHRVVRNNGEIGGYLGMIDGKKMEEKIKLLKSEGIRVENNRVVDFKNKKII